MKRVLAVVLLGFGLAAGAAVASVEDEIRDRIKPVGEVCLQGEECGEAVAAPAQAASSGPRSGSDVYNSACTACHATGAAGAPIVGNADQWAPRIEQGLETLISHAINGFNAMPPKGACASCSDEEIVAAVEHMVESSQ
ncbi:MULTISPECIES: c-type cytochrome [Marinobacter]|jgi:cytochrome c5|uniref:Cytochrome c5 family protein n=1 Tax=Marinobacter vinifirmus TaxID=355591 RepID=A0A259VZM4_9GAMM|nr:MULTISPECIES: cytochrome c5 family protein [Marinobacter]ERP91383.1 cytochrome C [Marinobacter sp. ES-1]OZC35796.1 cytochrome c5 family protein [Marinobacter vinifirmus]TVT34332.1 MAG: cytochrome c5 family protein [Marinobacter vinifirmus]|tara:strand:- start:5495 stop:5911 length:417 start_codon:yes stop_codon:yes gene_type:complete